MIPDSCPDCDCLPVRIQPLPRVAGYQSPITGRWIGTDRDDFRCCWCSTQWNQREREAGIWLARVA